METDEELPQELDLAPEPVTEETIESRFDGYRVYGTTLIFLWEIIADSYESAIRGFWDGEIVLNFGVI